MTVSGDDDPTGLKQVGRIVANTLEVMGKAIEPGMTTRELDQIGRDIHGSRRGAFGAGDGLRLSRRDLHQHQ